MAQEQIEGHRLEAGAKMTNWANEPKLLDLKKDVEAGMVQQKVMINKINEWKDLMEVSGKAKPAQVNGRSKVQPKLVRRQAEWRYSALSEPFLGTKKLFKIEPVTYEDVESARQNELVLNWQFRTKMNRVNFIDQYVRAVVDEGTAFLFTGWKRSTKKVKKTVPVFSYYPAETEEQVMPLQAAIQLRQENPHQYDLITPPEVRAAVEYFEETGEVTYAEQSDTTQVEVEMVLENKPVVELKDPRNVVIDPTCNGDFEKAMFVAFTFETNQADLKKDSKYKNLDKVMWADASPVQDPDHTTNTPQDFNFNDTMRKKVVATEYWGFYDVHNDGTLTPFVATWIGHVCIRMELNPFPDGKLPITVVTYLPRKRDVYGEPDAEVLGDNQAVVGAVMRGMIDSMGRSANGQIGFSKGLLDPMNRRKFDNGEDYEFNPGMNPQTGVIEGKYPEIPASAIEMLQLQNQDAEALTGVKSFSGGLSGSTYGDVATGIRGVLDAASKREMSILRRMVYGLTDVGKKIVAMNAEFMSEKEVVRVTNETYVESIKEDDFETISREDLRGNFDLMVDISTAEIDDAKAKDLGFMLQTIGPNMEPMLIMGILAEIADLKQMPDLAKKLRNWKPTPNPLAEAKAKAEVDKLMAEVAKINSEIELNKAKAREATANADAADLDFVEQETGTKHAREMEKQAGQARGNQQLEVTKAILDKTKEGEKKGDILAAIGFNKVSDKLEKEPAL